MVVVLFSLLLLGAFIGTINPSFWRVLLKVSVGPLLNTV